MSKQAKTLITEMNTTENTDKSTVAAPKMAAKPSAKTAPKSANPSEITLSKGKKVEIARIQAKIDVLRCKSGQVRADVKRAGQESLLREVSDLTGETYSLLMPSALAKLVKAGFIDQSEARDLRALASVTKALQILGA